MLSIKNIFTKISTNKNKYIIVSLILCLVSMIVTSALIKDFNRVSVENIQVRTEAGTLGGYLFTPATMEKNEKLPTILVTHGATANAEFMDSYYVELARRGYVVFAFSLWGHGDSSLIDDRYIDTINWKTNGVYDAVEYITTLDFVNTEKIGLVAHSMGSSSVLETAQFYSNLEADAINKGVSQEEAKKLNKIEAVLSVGYPIEFSIQGLNIVGNDKPFSGMKTKLGIIISRNDDFFYSLGNNFLENDITKNWLYQQTNIQVGADEAIEQGKIYTNPDDQSTFSAWSAPGIHNSNFFSKETTGYVIDFFDESIGSPNRINSNNQVWWIKQIFNLVGLIGMMMFVWAFIDRMLKTSFFGKLSISEPKAIAPLKTNKSKIVYYLSNLSVALINAVLLIPAQLMASMFLPTSFFTLSNTTSFALWSVISGIVILISLRLFGNIKFKGNMKEFGLIINWSKFIKTVLLALITVSLSFIILFFAKYAFNTDFRIWFIAFRPFTIDRLLLSLRYIPLFLFFFLISGFGASRNNFSDWSSKRKYITSFVFSILPIAIMLAITYLPILWTGGTIWNTGEPSIAGFALANATINLIPYLFTLVIVVTYNVSFYRKTGNPWLAAIVNAILFTLLSAANTSIGGFI